jgi:hypothetical protein
MAGKPSIMVGLGWRVQAILLVLARGLPGKGQEWHQGVADGASRTLEVETTKAHR